MVSFNNIAANVRVPLFYAEVDNSQASQFENRGRVLLVGQMLAAGLATANVPVLVNRTDEAIALFGTASMLAEMHAAYRARDSFGEVWCLPLDDAGGGAKATGSIVFAGTPSAAGTFRFKIGGKTFAFAVATTDTATTIGDALETLVNAANIAVTASNAAGTVTLTARHAGELGNDIDVRAYRAPGASSTEPAGVTATITGMASGTVNPALATAIGNMGDEEFDFIGCPYSDATSLDALKAELDDATGRWSWAKQVYGHVFSAKKATVSALDTFGATRNDQHASVFGIEPVTANTWEVLARIVAEAAKSLINDPARPLQTLDIGIDPANPEDRFTMQERQVLLTSGIATLYTGGGTVRIERAITTYQVNVFDQPDTSYLDANTLYSLAYILRFLKARITSKFGRHKLANDGTRFGAGQAIVTPNIIRAELIASYGDLERDGIVENAAAFAANLVVERNSSNANRVDVLFPPDLVNQLRVLAVLAQFRLQYPAQ